MMSEDYIDTERLGDEYGTCTCAKSGCETLIRYRAAPGGWRPRYCRAHMEDEKRRLNSLKIYDKEAVRKELYVRIPPRARKPTVQEMLR